MVILFRNGKDSSRVVVGVGVMFKHILSFETNLMNRKGEKGRLEIEEK